MAILLGPSLQPKPKRVIRGTSRVRYGSFVTETYAYTGPGPKSALEINFWRAFCEDVPGCADLHICHNATKI